MLAQTKTQKPIGVSGLPTAGYQFDIFEAILEKIEKVVLIVSKDASLSVFDISMAKSLTKGRGIDLKIHRVKDIEEAQQIAKKAEADSVDAILLGSDEQLNKEAKSLVEAAGKVPVISFYSEGVKKGVAIGFRPDYFKLGMSLGRQVLEHLLTEEYELCTPSGLTPYHPKTVLL